MILRTLSLTVFVLACGLACVSSEPQPMAEPDPHRPTAERLLQEFAEAEPFFLQAEIAEDLVALGDPGVLPEIEPFTTAEDRRTRCNAALVLLGLGDDRGLEILLRELHDTGPRPTPFTFADGTPNPRRQTLQDRYYAAYLLGKVKRREAVPALIEATRDPALHYIAAISLGKIGDRRAIPALYEMLERFPDQRLWVGYGLAELDEEEGIELLEQVFDAEVHWSKRRSAVEALKTLGDRRGLPLALRALEDEDVHIRVSAVRALGAIGGPRALAALQAALDDIEPTTQNGITTVRAEALQAIEALEEGSEKQGSR